jgi:predicted transcriptional regulator
VLVEHTAEKRGRFDICADMLRVLGSESGCNKAVLATRSNLDSRALSHYLGLLLRYELAQGTQGKRILMISEKGRDYLRVYTKLVALLD